jgi:hypothetical protein
MRKTLLCTTLALIFDLSAGAQASECSDIALVLAVDGSDSIDDKEYAFQKAAISAAFRDMAVIPTLRFRLFSGETPSPQRKKWGGSCLPIVGAESFADIPISKPCTPR